MKAVLFSLFVLTLSSQAMSSEVLLKYDYVPGFEVNRVYFTITVNDDGQVIKESHDGSTKMLKKESLAVLSKSALKRINEKRAQVTAADVLVDENPEGPQCTDTPTISVSVVRGDEEIIIQRSANCHLETTENYAAHQLAEVALGLAALAR